MSNYSSGRMAAMSAPFFSISLTNESRTGKHFASQMSYNDFLMLTNWLHLMVCVCGCLCVLLLQCFSVNEKWITLNKFTWTPLSPHPLTICIVFACFMFPLQERFQVYSTCFDNGTPAKSERAWKVMKFAVSSFSLIIFFTHGGMDLEFQSTDVLRQGRHMKRLQKS